jgi:hypothetical protein
MKYQPPKYSDAELLEIFPEAKKIIPLKLLECREAIKKKKGEIETALKKIHSFKTDNFSEWFAGEIIKMFMVPSLLILEKNLFRLNRLKQLIEPKSITPNGLDLKEKIERAREYPIREIAKDKGDCRQVGENFISLCPFHNEKTPSLYIYSDSNSFHCFGCQEHGDVIKLTMALYGVDFKDAVAMLQN